MSQSSLFLTRRMLLCGLIVVLPLAHGAEFVLRGTVRDTSRNILPEVKVSAGSPGVRVMTDDNGNFSMVLPERPRSAVNFDKPGYGERHIELPAGTAPMDVMLKPNQNNAGLIVHKTRISVSHSVTTVQQLEPALLLQPLTTDVYREFVTRHGEAAAEEVIVRLYLPAGGRITSVFLISEHGMGGAMMEQRVFRDFADRHQMALVGVIGEPIQRGIFPAETLETLVGEIGAKANHPQLGRLPVFTFGHSNGTGFSDLHAALRSERVLGWISYHCGGSWQLRFPNLGRAPGLVMHGQKDALFTDQDQVVRSLRHDRDAAVSLMVEGEASHWPVDRPHAYEFMLAFCEACLRIRAPHGLADGASLAPVRISEGWLASGYDREAGGLQSPAIAAYRDFKGDRATANWLPDAAFAREWQQFCGTGAIAGAR